MRVIGELLEKVIIDASGNEIGKVDDFEIDFETKSLVAIVVMGKGLVSKQLQNEKLASLMKQLKITKTEDLLIPLEDIQAVGKFILLKHTIEQQQNEPSQN